MKKFFGKLRSKFCEKTTAIAAKAATEGIRALKENKHFGVKSLQAHHDEIE